PISVVSEAEIGRWNESYRHKKGPTDVLSFPAVLHSAGHNRARAHRMRGKSAGIAEKFLGDVAIAPETARRYAKKNCRTLQSELRILMLHGVLQLVGYDHESANVRINRME